MRLTAEKLYAWRDAVDSVLSVDNDDRVSLDEVSREMLEAYLDMVAEETRGKES